jgi:D-alanine-D-alanine ligase
VFIALHGRDGEDGTIQLLCEALGVPYTGSPPLTCRFCFDKGLAAGILEEAGLPRPAAFVVPRDAVRHMGAGAALREGAARLGYPLVVKPTAQGSGLGLAVVEDAPDLTAAALAAFDHGDRILIESYVDGVDVSVVVSGREVHPLPGVEIRTRAKVFDFETRVSPGAYEFISPSTVATENVLEIATNAARLLGIRDFGRVDLRVDKDGPTILDVKTCPGLTESSIAPFAVDAAGISFDDFVTEIVNAALARVQTARA